MRVCVCMSVCVCSQNAKILGALCFKKRLKVACRGVGSVVVVLGGDQ